MKTGLKRLMVLLMVLLAASWSVRADAGLIPVPAGLTDGEYRLVPSADYLTGEGLLVCGSSGSASAWAYGAGEPRTLPDGQGFSGLMKGLFAGCSVTAEQGSVTGLILRPAVSGRRSGGDAVSVTDGLPETVRVTLAVVTRQSRREGRVTEDGAGLTLSARLGDFTVSMGDEPRPDRNNTSHFLSLNGSEVWLNPAAEVGSSARIGVPNGDGTWHTLTFTKADRLRITVEYHTADSWR